MSPGSSPCHAMIFAAGLGTRMRPITDTLPKPLVKVRGKALIDHVLDAFADAGVPEAVVNVHYLGDQIEAHLADRMAPHIVISDERAKLLDQGGGIRKALPLLGAAPFFVANTDAFWVEGPASNLRRLAQAFDPTRMDALLLLVRHPAAHNYQGQGDFHLDPLGHITRRRHGRVAPYIYMGVQLVSRRLLRDAPEGPFSTNILWNRAMEEGRLFGHVHNGAWIEVGEPGHIGPAEDLLSRG